MKIAVINNLNAGSTGNLSLSLVRYLQSQGEDARFYYAYGNNKSEGICFSNRFYLKLNNVFSLFGANRYAAIKHPTKRLLKELSSFKPDLINIHCLNIGSVNLKMLFSYAKEHNIPIIATCHAFFYSTGNCGHPVSGCKKYLDMCIGCNYSFFAAKSLFHRTHRNFMQMKSWFDMVKIRFVCVSDYVASMAKLSPLTKSFPIQTIINGIDTDVFKAPQIGVQHKPDASKIKILFTCSDTRGKLKGYASFVELVRRMANDIDFEFVFVGKIHDGFMSENLTDLGPISSRERMAEIYQQADLTIMLSKDETFGLPIAESLCCGTPVAFFKCGGCEAITISEFSGIFDYGDLDAFIAYIKSKEYLSFDRAEIANKAKLKYSSEITNGAYLKLMQEMVEQ